MTDTIKPLDPSKLYTPCPDKALNFKTTAELEPLDGVIGQDRALESIRFAIGMNHDGYNLFAFGAQGTGKSSTVRRFLAREAAVQAVPSDWCYVNNFDDAHKPRALELPAGKAAPLREDMERLVEELKAALPAAFEGEDYAQRKEALEEQLKARHEQAFSRLQERAAKSNVALVRTPMGLGLAPTKDGEVLSPKEFEGLTKKEQKSRQKALDRLQADLEDTLQQIPRWEKEHREKTRELNRQVTSLAVGHLIEELEKKWAALDAVQAYLEAVRADVVDNAADFLPSGDEKNENQLPGTRRHSGGSFRRYHVNVIVDNTELLNDKAPVGAPVVEEEHPTQPNLVGRVEHVSQMGALVTDFNLIKSGALHRANGGYLVLDALRVLTQPYAWEALKRALRSGHIRAESLAESLGWVTTVSLEPEPIPLKIKVVIIGDPMMYYLLSQYDPDFKELFKVAADFAESMSRDEAGAKGYARLLASQVAREDLRHLDRGAVARVVEHGARLAEDAERLTTHMASLVDLLREANYWAGVAGAKVIKAQHVQQAIDAKVY
ncbi:MAG: AAA family ATPase, partial [Alphaproteobacteria bacterium]|nr:AAA family ATPase [Alphaproteobacteria bacterium]